jgi:hypothetical protein
MPISSGVGTTPMKKMYVTINRFRSRHRILAFRKRNARIAKKKMEMKLETYPAAQCRARRNSKCGYQFLQKK